MADQHAAHERIRLEQKLQGLTKPAHGFREVRMGLRENTVVSLVCTAVQCSVKHDLVFVGHANCGPLKCEPAGRSASNFAMSLMLAVLAKASSLVISCPMGSGTFLVNFVFFATSPDRTAQRIFTLSGSNDAVWLK